ncbi:eukaryotic translation initiation factor 4G-like [Carex rostrata]
MSTNDGSSGGKGGLELLTQVDPEVLKVLVGLIQGASVSNNTLARDPPQVKLDLPPVEPKLDGPATYLSWSHQIETALVERKLEGYLTGDEPASGTTLVDEWRTTHAFLYAWILNSMKQLIASSVDGIRHVRDIWAKLKRTYGGTENNMRVFQIQQKIEAVVQGDRSIQDYSLDLKMLWVELDHFSQMSSCSDPSCKKGELLAQMRTMQFLAHLNSAFDQRRSVLLAQTKIPSLDETIAVMMQEESRMRIHAESSGPPGARSALAASSSGMTGVQGETCRYYNYGETGHLIKACLKPPKERDAGGRGQSENRRCSRGSRRGGRGGNWTNLIVAEEEEEAGVGLSEEDLIIEAASQILRRRQKGPQGGLGRNMSIRGQPGISNSSSAMGDRMGSGSTNEFGSGTSSEYGYGSREGGMGVRMASPEERTGPPLGWGQRGLDRNFSAGSRPAPPMVNQRAGLVASSPSSTSPPDSVIKEKSEFYSAKDEKEVAMCMEELFKQVKAMNIDSPDTLAGVTSQIFDKALMEPAFCEMYANLCSHLANVLPDFSEDNEKITFKRLLLNKCQEEFERGEREEAEAEKTEEEGEVKQIPEQREEKRVKVRRRMLGNIRLIGELYKKRMVTERIMHECIKRLLGPTQSPDEDDTEALCTLMSTIGEMIDHPKAKEHMDAYFDIMANLSTNQRYSSHVRFMLKDAIDLRRNKWQQRRKVEGPKKIEEVHRDAAQEHQAQSTRLSRGGLVMNNPPMRRGPQMGLVSPVSQQPGIRGMAPPQSGRGGFAMQDVWFEDRGDRYHFDNRNMNLSLPLPQGVNRDESITLGPQGGLGRNMSISDQPGISNASSAMGDRMGSGPTNGFGSGTSSEYGYGSREGGMGVRMASPEERTGPSLGWGQRGLDRNFSAGSRPAPPVVNRQAGLVASSPSSTSLPDSVIKEKSVSAIREFYSAKDEKEVAMCIEELKSPGSYHRIISTWVSDSFERKEVERDVLYKLLVNLCKPSGGLFPQAQLQQGLETVLSTLEDAVNDAPKAPEFLGRLFAKFIAEDVMSLEDIGRLVCEGGEEPGLLIEAGLGGDVIGCTLEYIKVEKGDSFLNDVRAGSNLQLEDFKPPPPARSKKLDPFL